MIPSLEEKCSKEAIQSASLILVDFDFYTSTALENDIAGYIRDSGYEGKMYLSTLHEEFDKDDRKKIASDFDGLINKREISGPKIQSLILVVFSASGKGGVFLNYLTALV